MTENDITRLSYLMASIVTTPSRAIRCIDRFIERGDPLPSWASGLPVLRAEIEKERGDGLPTKTHLITVGVREDHEETTIALDNLLTSVYNTTICEQ